MTRRAMREEGGDGTMDPRDIKVRMHAHQFVALRQALVLLAVVGALVVGLVAAMARIT